VHEVSEREAGDFAMLRLRRVFAMLVVGAGLSGCYPPPLSTPSARAPSVTSVYDGTYSGSVQLTYVAPMAQRSWCQTGQQASVQISNGSLTYLQPHPNVPGATVVT
jgi:hypothetical protein